MKFKINDTVIVLDTAPTDWFFKPGDIGKIIALKNRHGIGHKVQFDRYKNWGYADDHHLAPWKESKESYACEDPREYLAAVTGEIK